MANEEANINSEPNALFGRLAEPFDPSEIKWRVTHRTRDGSHGAVIAFADPRAYSDRLNQVFTPSGWTRTYEVNTVSSVTRMKKDKLIQTGKVLVTCTVRIAGLGTSAALWDIRDIRHLRRLFRAEDTGPLGLVYEPPNGRELHVDGGSAKIPLQHRGLEFQQQRP